MNTNEAVVRVRLDTSQAKQDLADLLKVGAGVAGAQGDGSRGGRKGMGGSIMGALGAGVRAVGIGAGIGAGIEAIRGPTAGSLNGAIGEALGGYGAAFENWALGDLAPEARASQRARDETKDAYATIAGMRGMIPPEARSFFAQSKALAMETEKGRAMFDRDEQFRGPGFEKIIDRVMEALAKIAMEAVEGLGNRIMGGWAGGFG